MMRVLKQLAPFALALAVATLATAAELAGVSMPDEMTVEGRTLVLNGLGLREATIFKIDVYVAGLYLETRSSDADAILRDDGLKRLQLTLVRRLSRAKIARAWRAGIEKNARGDLDALEGRIAHLNSCLIDLRSGDAVALTQIPGQGIVLEVKGEIAATVPGDDFARALWRIWLGEFPPSPGLKQGLLGNRAHRPE